MMELYEELLSLIDALNDAGVAYAICGGIALGLHGHPRMTKDIDLLVPASQADAIETAIRPLGYKFRALPMTFDPGTAKEREVRRISKIVGEETMTLDLILTRSSSDSPWETRVPFEWKGRPVWLVSREGLVLMKRLAGRPQDVADIAVLEGTSEQKL